MIAKSENLYHLIKKSKVDVISVTERCGSMPDETCRITTYKFIKNLKHLIKSGVFNNIDWKVEQKSETVLLLTTHVFDKICGTSLEVEITPFGKTTMQQVIDKLKETIFSKSAPQIRE